MNAPASTPAPPLIWDRCNLKTALDQSKAILVAAKRGRKASAAQVAYARYIQAVLARVEVDVLIQVVDLTVAKLNENGEHGPPPGFFGEV